MMSATEYGFLNAIYCVCKLKQDVRIKSKEHEERGCTRTIKECLEKF